MQGLDSFLMSIIIHNLSTDELANEWYRCVRCDRWGRTACIGVRQQRAFELNPERGVGFRMVGRDEGTDWPLSFNVKTHHQVNQSRSKLALLFHCRYPTPSVLTTKEAVANSIDQINPWGPYQRYRYAYSLWRWNDIFHSRLWFLSI